MTDTEIALCRMFAALWEAFQEGVGIDPVDLESMLDHSALAVWLPATGEDVKILEGFELEVGDLVLKLTDEGRRIRDAGRLSHNEDKPAGG